MRTPGFITLPFAPDCRDAGSTTAALRARLRHRHRRGERLRPLVVEFLDLRGQLVVCCRSSGDSAAISILRIDGERLLDLQGIQFLAFRALLRQASATRAGCNPGSFAFFSPSSGRDTAARAASSCSFHGACRSSIPLLLCFELRYSSAATSGYSYGLVGKKTACIAVIILLRNRIELVVVAARAADRHAEERVGCRVTRSSSSSSRVCSFFRLFSEPEPQIARGRPRIRRIRARSHRPRSALQTNRSYGLSWLKARMT